MAEPAAIEQVSLAWREAAARLLTALAHTHDPEVQVALLRLLSRRFGQVGYPGFLKLLLIIADCDDPRAKRGIADAIAFSLQRNDIPGGPLTAWGASQLWSSRQAMSASILPGNTLGVAPRRQFGPIEYLTVWHIQRTQRPYLSEDLYRDALTRLIGLFDHSAQARRLYPLKIEHDLAAGAEGAYTRRTRARLATLARAWQQGLPPDAVAQAVVAADAPNAKHTRGRTGGYRPKGL